MIKVGFKQIVIIYAKETWLLGSFQYRSRRNDRWWYFRCSWKNAYEGLFIIGLISIIFANAISLESISTIGSGGFLLIFSFVNLAAFKLRDKLKINSCLPLIGAVLTFTVLSILLFRMSKNNIFNLLIFAGFIFTAFIIEAIFRFVKGRKIKEVLDERLLENENIIKNRNYLINKIIKTVSKYVEDAEVYLVGSIARGEIKKSGDIDFLVLTKKSIKGKEREIMRNVNQEVKVCPGLIDIHFENKKKKQKALKKAKHYKALKQ